MLAPVPKLTTARSLRGLLLASILVPIAVFIVAAWESKRELYHDAERNIQRRTAILFEHAAKVLQAQQLVIEQAQDRIKGLSWEQIRTSDAVWTDLKRLAGDVQHVDAIFVIDPSGKAALTTRARPSPAVDFSDRDYFVAQRQSETSPYLSARYIGKISRRPIFNVSVRRADAQGFDGVVGVSAFIEYFERVYATLAEARDGAFVSLERADGQVLASYPPVGATPQPVVPPAAADGLVYSTDPQTEVSRIVAYRKLPGFPAYIAYGLDESFVLSAWYRNLWRWGLLTLAAGSFLTFASWLALRTAREEATIVEGWLQTQADLVRETQLRQQAEAALFQSQKLEALGQLTTGVAHDFGNLLQILKGHLGMAKARAGEERVRAAIATCEGAVQRSEKLVQHLLAFARRQPLSYEIFDLNERLPAMLDTLQQLGGGIRVELHLPGDLWPVEADPTQFELVVINLVANARDAMGHGGTVRITAANRALSKGQGERTGDFIAVSVSDEGAGIAPELLDKIWEPFFTTKAAGKGTGLGLSTVYGFAKQSGGFVEIASEVGVGTTVSVFLPKGAGLRTRAVPPPAVEAQSSVVVFPGRD